MASVIVTFKLNHIGMFKASVEVFNPFNVSSTGKKDTGGRYVDTYDSDEGYVLPNADSVKLIDDLIDRIPFALYDRGKLLTFRTLLNTGRKYQFTIKSPLPRLAREFYEIWEEYLEGTDS
tara:strand:- start:117 stop:476 length:360 start_codon:yes stop_codon:yes gene_type:complete